MTSPHPIPAVAFPPLPSCCWVCGGDGRVGCSPVETATDGSRSVIAAPSPVDCPHCTAPDGLLALIEVAW